jgi:hypothetical protein
MAPAIFLALTIALPTIDMPGACRGEERGLPKDQYASAYKDCIQAEQAALTELRQKWAQFPSSAKAPCAALAQTFDSYVEELVCVQIRAGHSVDDAAQK